MKKCILVFALIIAFIGQVMAQVNISGKVTNISGEPIPGANIIVKGTSQGTVTDADGNYSLGNISTDAILVFSFLGMLTEEITVGNQTEINITLIEDIQSLDEVVVIGYGSVKRANLTGAVVDIKAEELENIPVGNLATALEGKLAGVKIGTSTGKPGAATSLKIRTESSYGRATEDVIYVIDGVIYDADRNGEEMFNLLDASEVESISVLKDAAAAVYGARAAGGVVVVKTKGGKKGKAKINYSGSYGIANATKFPEMLNAVELATMYNDILDIQQSIGMTVNRFRYYSDDELAYFDSIEGYDWMDEVLQLAYTAKHTLNVEGGTDNIRYFAGGAYYDEKGMIEDLFYKKYSLRTKIEADITKNLTATIGVSYYYNTHQEPNFNNEKQGGVLRDTYKQALTAPPWVPISIDGKPVNNQVSLNPLGLFESGSYKKDYENNSNLIAGFEYKIPVIKGLKLNFQYSRSENNGRGKEYARNYINYNFPTTGTNRHIVIDTLPPIGYEEYGNDEGIRESSSYGKNYQLNASVNYSKKFGVHDISALLVYEQSEREDNTFYTQIEQVPAIEGYDYLWAYSVEDDWISASSYHETAYLGYIGRLNYSYADKYLFESTFRYEASQKFHPDNRWGFFPAVSGGWVISEENFFKNSISFMNFLKIRASAGIVGNDNVPAFTWKPTFQGDQTGPIFGGSQTNAIIAKNNLVYIPSITWQESKSYNIGLDSRMLNSKLKFGLDLYYRFTYNIFNRRENVPTTLGLSTGARVPEENYGEMYAKGIEVELGYDGNIGNSLKYKINGNFSWDKHRKLKVFQNPAVVGTWEDQLLNDPSNQPGMIALGIMRTQEQLDAWMEQYPDYTVDGFPLQLGMIYYKDVRGPEYTDSITGQKKYLPPDGIITGADRTIIAEYTNPPYHYGFSLGLSWKSISIEANFDGVFGHKVFISKDEQFTPDPEDTDVQNVFGFWRDYWTPENPDAVYPRPYLYGYDQQMTTFWMRNGHTLRMNNLKATYKLPTAISNKIGIPQLRLYFTSRNLWTIINPFDHKDPGISRGYDYPLMRTFNFGINITL